MCAALPTCSGVPGRLSGGFPGAPPCSRGGGGPRFQGRFTVSLATGDRLSCPSAGFGLQSPPAPCQGPPSRSLGSMSVAPWAPRPSCPAPPRVLQPPWCVWRPASSLAFSKACWSAPPSRGRGPQPSTAAEGHVVVGLAGPGLRWAAQWVGGKARERACLSELPRVWARPLLLLRINTVRSACGLLVLTHGALGPWPWRQGEGRAWAPCLPA